ncbi:MAG: RNA methyltransferase [Ruminococcus sp.]|nr:RNA methyltransferase [Ruminococcus sp.]
MLITSKDNLKIKQYRKLAESRKARTEQGLFVAEGMRGIVDIAGEADISALFCTEAALEKYAGLLDTGRLSLIPEDRRFTVTDEVADKMSDTGSTQGVFAVVKKLDLPLEDTLPIGKYLVLDELQDPGNLGTMIRTAAAVGLSGVILSGNCADLYNPKTVRSCMGSLTKVNIYIEKDVSRVLAVLDKSGIKTLAAVVRDGQSVSETDFSGGCAVVIGNEGRGLPEETATLCRERVTIKMRGSTESLNAAIAGTILVWEMSGRDREL